MAMPGRAALLALTTLLAAGPAPGLAASDPLAEGLEQLARGRYREAESALREALRLDPDSAEAHFYLGQVLNRLDRPAEAAAELETARDAGLDRPGLHLSLGTTYFELDRHEDARRELELAVARNPESGEALLLLGLTELERGRTDAAAGHFERVVEVDPELAQLALYNLGAARSRQGDAAGARAALRRAVDVDPTSTTAGYARTLLDRVQRAPGGPRRWSLSGSVGLLYDDNVTAREVDSTTGDGDGGASAELAATYRLGDEAPYALELGYDLFQTVYFDASDFNLQVHSLSATGSRSLETVEAKLGYRYTLSTLGGDRFLDIHEVRPSVELALSPRWYAIAGPRFQVKRFDTAPRRDARQAAFGALSFFFFNENRAYALGGLRFESENADGSEFDYDGLVLETGLHVPFGLRGRPYEIDLGYRHRRRDYDHVTPSIGERRDDRIHTFRARLTRDLGESFELRLELEYTDSESNLPAADYIQRTAGLSFAFSF